MYTISDLISLKNLSDNDVKATLEACGLSVEQGTYSQEDISKFDSVRNLFDTAQVSDYQTAKELFNTISQVKPSKPRTKKQVKQGQDSGSQQGGNGKEGNDNNGNAQQNTSAQTLSVIDLMALVKKHLDLDLTLKQVVEILQVSGIGDKSSYSQQEANKFLIACKVLLDTSKNQLADIIENTTGALESSFIDLLDAVTKERAKEVPSLIKQLYMQNVAISLIENQDEIEGFFMQLKEGIIKGIEGKSPMRSILEVDWTAAPLNESGSSVSQLPMTSENITNTDLMPDTKP